MKLLTQKLFEAKAEAQKIKPIDNDENQVKLIILNDIDELILLINSTK